MRAGLDLAYRGPFSAPFAFAPLAQRLFQVHEFFLALDEVVGDALQLLGKEALGIGQDGAARGAPRLAGGGFEPPTFGL